MRDVDAGSSDPIPPPAKKRSPQPMAATAAGKAVTKFVITKDGDDDEIVDEFERSKYGDGNSKR